MKYGAVQKSCQIFKWKHFSTVYKLWYYNQIQYFIQWLFSKFNDFIQIYSKRTFAKMLSIVIILIKFSRTIHLIDMSTILKW